MKKLFSMLLVLTLLVSLTACSGTNDSNEANPKESSTGETSSKEADSDKTEDATGEEGLPRYKIGVLYWGYTDVLGAQIKKNMDYIGEQFNCEIVYAQGTGTLDSYVTGTENLIQSGVDGIINLFGLPGIIESCEKSGVYLVQALNETTDPDTLKLMKESPHFVGMFTENDYLSGYTMVKDLYESGCRNVIYMAPAPGLAANHDNRVRGIEDALTEYNDMKLLSNYRGPQMTDALQNFAAVYPEMDGLIVTGGSNGGTEAIYQMIQSEGLTGKVKFATIDIGQGTGERLESGDLAWIAGGQYATTGIAFTALYNAIVGTPLIEDNTQAIYRPFMTIKSMEEYSNYEKYVAGDIPAYTGEELKALIKKLNPDASMELYKKFNDGYSIEDVVERHKDLF